MSLFHLDCECSYEDFLKTIYYHATRYRPRGAPIAGHHLVCRELLDAAQGEYGKGRYDHAFFYYVRCLDILDKMVPRHYRDASLVKRKCLDAIDDLRDTLLKDQYRKMIDEINSSRKGRTEVPNVSDHPGADANLLMETHKKRQELLLTKEGTAMDQIKKQIAETCIPCDQSNLTSRNNHDWDSGGNVTIHSDLSVSEPRSAPCAHPSVYAKWSYGTGFTGEWKPRRGMVNLGNTCYLNSVVQVLSSTPLGMYFLGDAYTLQISTSGSEVSKLVNSFSYVVRELSRTDVCTPVSPSPFRRAVGEVSATFLGSKQQDANEFLRVLLEGLHEGLNKPHPPRKPLKEPDSVVSEDDELSKYHWDQYRWQNNSVVVDNCAFQERSSIKCSNCKRCSRSFTCSLGIDVPVPSGCEVVSIEDCFRAYCREEVLDTDSQYHCSSCNQKVKAWKQLLLYSLPTVLFVTIKRFRSDGNISSKLNDCVYFEKNIDLKQFICSSEKETRYVLVGVVNHRGNMCGGHYTADYYDSKCGWYSASDERVTRAEAPDYRLAYILCYVRVSAK